MEGMINNRAQLLKAQAVWSNEALVIDSLIRTVTEHQQQFGQKSPQVKREGGHSLQHPLHYYSLPVSVLSFYEKCVYCSRNPAA